MCHDKRERVTLRRLHVRSDTDDAAAFEELTHRCMPKLYAVARSYPLVQSSEEDRVQEALLEAFRTFRYLRQREKICSWLKIICIRICIRYAKLERRLPTLSLDSPSPNEETSFADSLLSTEDDPIAQLILNEVYEKLQSCLAPREAHVFQLLRKGFSQVEIAELLGCRPQNINQCLTRVRMKWSTFNA